MVLHIAGDTALLLAGDQAPLAATVTPSTSVRGSVGNIAQLDPGALVYLVGQMSKERLQVDTIWTGLSFVDGFIISEGRGNISISPYFPGLADPDPPPAIIDPATVIITQQARGKELSAAHKARLLSLKATAASLDRHALLEGLVDALAGIPLVLGLAPESAGSRRLLAVVGGPAEL